MPCQKGRDWMANEGRRGRVLAFVNVFVESTLMNSVIEELRCLKNLEELYEVTGEYDIVALVVAADVEEFRDILVNKIMRIRGVRSTVTDIVLHAHKTSMHASGLRVALTNEIAPQDSFFTS